jgi:hypothetical protein
MKSLNLSGSIPTFLKTNPGYDANTGLSEIIVLLFCSPAKLPLRLPRPGQAERAKAAGADLCVPCVREQGTFNTLQASDFGERARADELLLSLKKEGVLLLLLVASGVTTDRS